MKAYKVYGCRIDGGTDWSGTVVDAEEKGVSEAVKKKFGLDYLYCEKYPDKRLQQIGKNQFDFEETTIENIPLQELTVGELFGILMHTIEVNKMAVMEARKVSES